MHTHRKGQLIIVLEVAVSCRAENNLDCRLAARYGSQAVFAQCVRHLERAPQLSVY